MSFAVTIYITDEATPKARGDLAGALWGTVQDQGFQPSTIIVREILPAPLPTGPNRIAGESGR